MKTWCLFLLYLLCQLARVAATKCSNNVAFGTDNITSPERTFEFWSNPFVPIPTPNSKCEHQVQQYLLGLQNLEFWAMQMWDATAKPAGGLLNGNSLQLGDFDGCLGVDQVSRGLVGGKYCLAEVDLEVSPQALPSVKHAVDRIQADNMVIGKHSDPIHFLPRWSTLRWGLCVPAECSNSEVLAGLTHFLQAYQLPGVTAEVDVKPGMCYTSQTDYTLPLSTKVTLGFFGGMVVLAVAASFVDYLYNYPLVVELSTRDRALLAFSLQRNWQTLVSTQAGRFPAVHGIRSIFAILLIASHALIGVSTIPFFNRISIHKFAGWLLFVTLRTPGFVTDPFLFLSGLLTSYGQSKEMASQHGIAWGKNILARIIRLSPGLIAVLLFYAYVFEHLGSGPQWYSHVSISADLCKTNLWSNILYYQNLYNFEEMCAPHTYHVALEFQLSFLAPLVVYCLHYWPRRSSFLVICLVALSALRLQTFLHYELADYVFKKIRLTDLYRYGNHVFSKGLYRAIPYIIGLFTGCFLQRNSSIQLSKIQVVTGWGLCALLTPSSCLYHWHRTQSGSEYDFTVGAWLAALYPIAQSISLSWLVVACSSGYGGWLNKLLSHQWFLVLSRLSYGIYLTQFIIYFYGIGITRSSVEFSIFHYIGVYEIMGILLASLFVTMLFDLPMQSIRPILFSAGSNTKQKGS